MNFYNIWLLIIIFFVPNAFTMNRGDIEKLSDLNVSERLNCEQKRNSYKRFGTVSISREELERILIRITNNIKSNIDQLRNSRN